MTIRLLIADDHVFYREGVKTMLGALSEVVAVVGEAASGEEAVRATAELTPDVVLMDLRMPGMNGIEATRKIVAARPQIAVLVLTMFDDESVFAALRAGARGYLLKDASVDDLIRAVTAVHHGEAIFSPAIADRLVRYFNRPVRTSEVLPELTDREREILALIVQGRGNAQIAQALTLTPKTVRNYVSNVLGKLQVHDRAQAIVRAREAGFTVE
ncbi:response regulator transcription factor [Kribbella sp. NPDC051718]|uniref:response regulator transcription factor n=1 Tax=Kribbella sp. NPDC051718 TaxID=3155168 RepID=UPI0034487B6D